MPLAGTRLTVLAGPTIPLPLTAELTEAIREVEITESEDGRSGFQMVLDAPRSKGLLGETLILVDPRLQSGARVIVFVVIGGFTEVLFDGFIWHRQLNPASGNTGATVVLTGSDIAAAMDLKHVTAQHPAQPPFVIVTKLVAKYARYGIIPAVLPSRQVSVPNPLQTIPNQNSTDYTYITKLAKAADYVFRVRPGPIPLASIAYWGPRVRIGIPQPALTVDMGPETNVALLKFEHDTQAAARVSGAVQDRNTNTPVRVQSLPISNRIPLSVSGAFSGLGNGREVNLDSHGDTTAADAQADAQAQADATTDVVTGTGELEVARYGNILRSGKLVGVRGAGIRFDGLYEVREVNTKVENNSIKQTFKLARDGIFSTVAVVPL